MNWIRVAVAIGDDPDIHRLADALGCRVAEAVGLVVCTLARFPEHAPDGNLAQIPASLIERWAGWEGDRGHFDAALRATFLSDTGVWESWEKHNGNALKKLERDRERLRVLREEKADTTAKLAGVSRDGRGVVAGTDGRTDEVLTTGGRKRPWNRNGEPPAANTPWCVECQGVVVTQPNGMPKKVHAPECSRA